MLKGFYSDKGRVKTVNQDSALLRINDNYTFIAVCDGMGGLQCGEKASSFTINQLNEWFNDKLPLFTGNVNAIFCSLNGLIDDCNEQLNLKYNYSSGTTLCAVLIMNGKFYTVNIGDSRAYRIHNTKIEQLTRDQSYAQLLREQGKSEEEISHNPKRNALLQCIGTYGEPEAVFTEGNVLQGDIFFVCSDGFRHYISSEEMFSALVKCTDDYSLDTALTSLAKLCMDRGERDNISVVAVQI